MTLDLDKTLDTVDRNTRRLLALTLGILFFLFVGTFGAKTLGAPTIQLGMSFLAGVIALYTWYAAQKDNRDFASGRISAIVTSTAKDIVATGAAIAIMAAVAWFTKVSSFGAVIAGSIGVLGAWWIGRRLWVEFK